ncbi:MAG: BTAD domain-containing putative transcriptional regulator [Armatimonadota bacterium]|nr:BTAD domain-containing putative transcriptional regulator [Armatimonadota bacterium]MDR7447748.1 BTAD domain-containing putative transcriptional regulator [Armatimonadota bacterium]MDR7458525.1 BTAD domain-containing putative transcriptional regulator [Armatimonadota bacterium]MDR7479918.1 BTAD domain-containing putative transcriptional regulator [Armatimonadota bacterium]MDR7487734.1 BTAD domain-containing putative transcriptional regulator [Armatimonadota bacterium]
MVYTLGRFRVLRDGEEIPARAWRRRKALLLFQFLLTARHRPMLKDEIVDRLWPDLDPRVADRDFKVALHALWYALEPRRRPRQPSRFVRRVGEGYQVTREGVWVDADAMEAYVAAAAQQTARDPAAARAAYRAALDLYGGDYLPDRRYDDWATAERERLQTLALGAMAALAGLLLDEQPRESLRLAGRMLAIDPAWEEAYRIAMRAHLATGNRVQALRSYERCVAALRELGLEPLPETQALARTLRGRPWPPVTPP